MASNESDIEKTIKAAIVEKQLAFINMRELTIKMYNHTYISSVDGSVMTDMDLKDVEDQIKKETERFEAASYTIDKLKEYTKSNQIVKEFEKILYDRLNSFMEGD